MQIGWIKLIIKTKIIMKIIQILLMIIITRRIRMDTSNAPKSDIQSPMSLTKTRQTIAQDAHYRDHRISKSIT